MARIGRQLIAEGGRAVGVWVGEGSAAWFYDALYLLKDLWPCQVCVGHPCHLRAREARVGQAFGFRSLASTSGRDRERFFFPMQCKVQGHWLVGVNMLVLSFVFSLSIVTSSALLFLSSARYATVASGLKDFLVTWFETAAVLIMLGFQG